MRWQQGAASVCRRCSACLRKGAVRLFPALPRRLLGPSVTQPVLLAYLRTEHWPEFAGWPSSLCTSAPCNSEPTPPAHTTCKPCTGPCLDTKLLMDLAAMLSPSILFVYLLGNPSGQATPQHLLLQDNIGANCSYAFMPVSAACASPAAPSASSWAGASCSGRPARRRMPATAFCRAGRYAGMM